MAKSDMSDSEDNAKGLEAELSCETSRHEMKKKSSDISSESSNESLCVANKNTNLSAHISIFIAALVKNLVAAYENDGVQVDLKYKVICDKLYQMKMIDESYQMKELDSILAQYQYALFHLLTSKGTQKPLSLHPEWPDENLATSHYHREFEELEYIAGGGFGQVYKVRHKLDGTEYAVKKIAIRSEGLEYVKNYLSEVKTFASVNHPNIVQYKAAWLDMGLSQNSDILTDYEDDDHYLSTEISDHKYRQEYHLSQEYLYNNEITTSFSNKFNEDTSDFEIVFEHSINNIESHCNSSSCLKKKSKRTKRDSVSEGGNALCPLDQKEINEIKLQQKMHEKWATLYIQMALCQLTLKQWLSQRNSLEKVIDPMKALVPVKIVQDSTVKEILKQLLEGLQYIHSKRIVHHDIKPSNIFLQTDNGKLLVQLGDFGLACPLQSVRHSLAFGTKLYAAPEQLAGKCNPKSDMYSLGIVLFELVETFTTDMERNKYIEELKKTGYLPPRIVMQHPQFAEIITRLVNKLPQNRPSAYELLDEISDSNTSTDSEIQELKSQLAEKDEEIQRLKQLLMTAGIKSKEELD
ncbi:probable serine/threonine-protein kinase ifkC [Harmonia axyridis]|uniref:probable serine/threonine-protein kinase ifkC n=1 Tax=Harmonia axyridis TaxID=115357 RepID=UPI001E2799B8|nr:probable serine/threonine-protein kinase ifkC [Harmonia axyridis]